MDLDTRARCSCTATAPLGRHTDLNSCLCCSLRRCEGQARDCRGHYVRGVRGQGGESPGLIDNCSARRTAADQQQELGRLRVTRRAPTACELNVVEQGRNIERTTIVQDAWAGPCGTDSRMDLRPQGRHRHEPASHGQCDCRHRGRRRDAVDVYAGSSARWPRSLFDAATILVCK